MAGTHEDRGEEGRGLGGGGVVSQLQVERCW